MRSRTRAPGRRVDAVEPTIEEAKAMVLRVLAFHARSEAQLRARLVRAGATAHVEEVIAWVRRLGYLDDAAYARGRARALLGRVGPRLAERRLLAAGIAPEMARFALAAALDERAERREPDETAEVALCRAALRARLRGADPASLDQRSRTRLARFLLGRGFSAAAVTRVLSMVVDPEA